MRLTLLLLSSLLLFSCNGNPKKDHNVENKSIDQVRAEALEEWKSMKFGLFIHWGIYSIPAGVWEGKQIDKLGEQIQRHAEIPHDEYVELASQFNPVNFDASKVAKMAKDAGMKYIVLTAKHHDGFCMFDSEYTDFDIIDATPYKKDILKQLADACRDNGLKLGIYYSTPDWHFNHPNVEINPIDNKISVFGKVSPENEEYQVNQLKELLTNYGDVVELFFDMGEPTAAQSQRFAETIHEYQPSCVVNGRIMNNQGDFITMPDNHVPELPIDTLAWETPGTFYHTWGYKSWVSGKGDPVETQVKNQVRKLSQIVARGGNFLLNVGPKSDGTIIPYEMDIIAGMGDWMDIYGEAITDTETTPFVRLPWGECTQKGDRLYFHIHSLPNDKKLFVPGLQSEVVRAFDLAQPDNSLEFTKDDNGYWIDIENIIVDDNLPVIALDYTGKLDIIDPIIKEKDGTITLKGGEAIRHGKYGRESYRSILKDYYRTWDIEANQTGKYEATITYSMRYKDKDFKLCVDDLNCLDFTLYGAGSEKAKAEAIDGNEVMSKEKKKKESKYISATLGIVDLKAGVRQTIYLRQGQNFEMHATTADFMDQDHRYRAMNIDIKNITLRKIR